MSFNGSGTFVINSAGQPVVANTVISATVFNALTADLATGLSTCITKDGQTTPTANIPMGSNKITTLAAGTAATDAANLGQVQSTAAKLVTVSGTDTVTGTMSPALTAYAAGQLFYFVAAGTNTTAMTINIDGLGAKAITRDGSTALAAGDVISGEIVVICYDGTRFQMINAANSFGNATITGSLTLSGGTANGVLYLDGSKVATSGTALVFDGSNLGIGTSSPQAKLEVAADTNATVSARISQSNLGTSAIASLRLDTQGNSWSIRSGRDGGYLSFHDAGGERARFDNSGNLGIGTISPAARLHVDSGAIDEVARFNSTGNPYISVHDSGVRQFYIQSLASDVEFVVEANKALLFYTNNTKRVSITALGSVVAGNGALATTATDGFLYVPTCAGTPTGVPTAITGMAPIVVNTTNNKLYFYSGGSWRDAGP